MVLRLRLAILLAGIVCLMRAGTAGAQQIPPPPYRFFPDDATPAPGTIVDQNAIVGFAAVNNGMFETPSSPTVTVGDDVDFRGNTYLYNSSTLNLNGFSSLLSLYPNDNATANLNSGFLFEVRASANSRVVMTGGSVQGALIGADSSHFMVSGGEVRGPAIAPSHTTIDISGGSVGSFSIFGDGTCSLSGGRVSSASVDVDSTLNITGGEVGFSVGSSGRATANVAGGQIDDDLFAQNTGKINLTAGSVAGDLLGRNDSVVSMSGGHVAGSPIFHDRSTFNFSGGSFGFGSDPAAPAGLSSLTAAADALPTTGLIALDNSTINVLGVGLSSTLIDPNATGNTSEYELTGRFADGTALHAFAFVQNGTAARLNLIEVAPEPSTLGLLAACAVVAGMSRRTRKRTIR